MFLFTPHSDYQRQTVATTCTETDPSNMSEKKSKWIPLESNPDVSIHRSCIRTINLTYRRHSQVFNDVSTSDMGSTCWFDGFHFCTLHDKRRDVIRSLA